MAGKMLGRTLVRACGVVGFGVLVTACGGDDPRPGDVETTTLAMLKGRAFSADTGEPLKQAEVRVGDIVGQVDAQGAFSLDFAPTESRVELRAAEHAPVSKSTPSTDGYLELMAKKIDAQKQIDPALGGEVKAANGAVFKVDAGKLGASSGESVKEATIVIAAPDPKKSQQLGALPGEFTAQKGGQVGKLSTESPVFVGASENGRELMLKAGSKAALTLPAHDRSVSKAAGSTLYRYDLESGRWIEAGGVTSGEDDQGLPVYHAEIDQLGWFSVGTFVQGSSCVHACVVDGQGRPVPAAVALATGVDLFTQARTFADTRGCFALEIPQNARMSLVVQGNGGASQPVLVQSAMAGSPFDPSSCEALETIVIGGSSSMSPGCPIGSTACGAGCVDLANDPQYCGSCDNACSDTCVAGECGSRMVPIVNDAGVIQPVLDASVPIGRDDGGVLLPEDGGVSVPVDAAVPPDAGPGGGGTDAGFDAGLPDAGMGVGVPVDGGEVIWDGSLPAD